MKVPFVEPASASLLLLQSLFMYLHYFTDGFWAGDHWALYLSPIFVFTLFVVAILTGNLLFEGKKRMCRYAEERSQGRPIDQADDDERNTLKLMLKLMIGIFLLLTLILFIFYLDEDTDLPAIWVATSFFAACTLTSISLGWIYSQARRDSNDDGSFVYILGALLVFTQGFMIWFFNTSWSDRFNIPYWVIVLPVSFFLLASLYRSIVQARHLKNEDSAGFVQVCFGILLISMSLYLVLSSTVYLSHPEIRWAQPKAISLVCLVVSSLILAASIFSYSKRDRHRPNVYQEIPMHSPPLKRITNIGRNGVSYDGTDVHQNNTPNIKNQYSLIYTPNVSWDK